MTIIRPKRSKETRVNPALALGVCCIIMLAAGNVIAYDKIVGITSKVATEKKSLDNARGKNVELKKQWYQALDQESLKAFVKEYGFVKVSSPGYISS